jgi:hypothetical protein
MICLSVMLALVQLWPVVFGHRMMPTVPAKAAEVLQLASAKPIAAPHRVSQPVPAAATGTAKSLPATGAANPIGCYQRYQLAYRACSPRDSGCRMAAADHWDLCEATGLWKE